MKNILIHGLDQDDKSWDKVKEYLREYNYNVICPNIFDLLKMIVMNIMIFMIFLKNE